MDTLKKQVSKLPDNPGVYFFRGKRKEILYIGKATSLRDRVRSYFARDLGNTRGQRIVQMVQDAQSVTFEETGSVLEALVLEAFLIKKHQPKYNVQEKDNKSYNYVVITKEDFPRVLVVREREIRLGKIDFDIKESFGPFTQGKSLKEALKIVRKIFPFRDKCKPVDEMKKPRACFNYQIGLCPGTCIGAISKKDYAKQIRHISLFFQGKKKQLLTSMEKEMKKYAKAKEFELAESTKRQIFALNHIKDVSMISEDLYDRAERTGVRIEGYDVAHMAGQNVVGVMTVVIDSEAEKNEYRKFIIKGGTGNNDVAALREILERRFNHDEWEFPGLIVVDGSVAQINTAEKFLVEKGLNIPVCAITKDETHKAKEIKGDSDLIQKFQKEILLVNAEAHRYAIAFFRNKQRKSLL